MKQVYTSKAIETLSQKTKKVNILIKSIKTQTVEENDKNI